VFSAQLHPEFGYFGASSGMRRVLAVTLVVALFGLVAGAGSIRSMLGYDPDRDTPAVPAQATQADNSNWVAPSVAPARLPPRPQVTASGAGRTNVVKSDPAKACEEITWAYLDGKCVGGKTRKPRIVRVPTHRPAIALIPLGRNVSAGTDIGASKATAGAADAADAKSAASKSAKASETASSTPDAPLQAFATAKKPQRTAQRRTHRSTRSAAYNDPWARQSRGWGGGTRYSGWSW